MTHSVAILGGGIGGLSAAHELAERGFEVTVYEAKSRFGGKARSIPIKDTHEKTDPILGEHGFRFFPGFYRHVTDTMSRIPYQNGRTVEDNLVSTSESLMARATGEELITSTQTPETLDEQDIRRIIARDCIYGVDVNGMAVELAKLSMWLETLATNQPLAFLDHHLKAGNSLVGSDITEVLSDDTEEEGGQLTLQQALARVCRDTLEHMMELMSELLAIDNESLADIKSMEDTYDEIRSDPLYGRLFEMANVHTAKRFGLDVPEGAYEEMADAIDDEAEWAEVRNRDWFRSAQAIADEEDFFHWELEYPEVFFGADGEKREDGEFDAVVGNPPYVRIQELRMNVPQQAEYLTIYQSSTHNFDLYANFTEKGYALLARDGYLGYIEPHKFFQSDFGEGLREFLADRDALTKILSFGHVQVFENASVCTCVLILSKNNTAGHDYAEISPSELELGDTPNFRGIEPDLNEEPWVFKSPEVISVLHKIEQHPLTLADATKKIYQGVITSADNIYLVALSS